MEGKEIPTKEEPLQISRFNKQGYFHMRLVWGGCKNSRSCNPPFEIFEVYIQALPRVSHIVSPDSLNHTLLSQTCILASVALAMGMVGETYSTEEGGASHGSLQLANQSAVTSFG